MSNILAHSLSVAQFDACHVDGPKRIDIHLNSNRDPNQRAVYLTYPFLTTMIPLSLLENFNLKDFTLFPIPSR